MEWCCRWFFFCSVFNWFGAHLQEGELHLFLSLFRLKSDEIGVDYRHDLSCDVSSAHEILSVFSKTSTCWSTLFSLFFFVLILLQAHRLICNKDLWVLFFVLFWYFFPLKKFCHAELTGLEVLREILCFFQVEYLQLMLKVGQFHGDILNSHFN